MLKDIPEQTVEDIAIAVLPKENEIGEREWNVYIINLKNVAIENVLITSKGYGTHKGEEVKTSTLRHFIEIIPPQGFERIEPIIETVFGLNNEYWVSFYIGSQIFERKFLFLPETISDEYLSTVPVMNLPGVVIR
jgi:hypothetical protein